MAKRSAANRYRLSKEAGTALQGAVPGLKRSGKRASAGGGARMALAKAAATRTAVAMRSTNVMGKASRRVASAAPSGGSNGQVKAYTRMLNGQSVFVSGYQRTV